MRLIKVLLNIMIIFTAFAGDYIVFRSKYSESLLFRAVSDSSVHGLLGLLSAIIFFTYKIDISLQAIVYNIIFCTLLSSVIDIDHFIVAKSIYLKDLINLKQRGIFHCTSFWLLITAILFIYSYLLKKHNIYILTYMVVLAYVSHHIRDGNRRGLWIYPYGHTGPINKYLYMALIVVVPNVLGILYSVFKSNFSKDYVVDYKMIV